MSVYASIDRAGGPGPGVVDGAGTYVDVAVGLGDVRLGVWIGGTWEPCAYLTPAQALDVARALMWAAQAAIDGGPAYSPR